MAQSHLNPSEEFYSRSFSFKLYEILNNPLKAERITYAKIILLSAALVVLRLPCHSGPSAINLRVVG